MNAKLLAPLVQEHLKQPQLSAEDLQLLLRTGNLLQLDEKAVNAIIAMERELLQATEEPPYEVFFRLLMALQVEGKFTEENEQYLQDIAYQLNINSPALQALVKVVQALQKNLLLYQVKLSHEMAKAFWADGEHPTRPLREFYYRRTQDLHLHLELAKAILEHSTHPDFNSEQAVRRYYAMLGLLLTHTPYNLQETEYLQLLAQELGLSTELAQTLQAVGVAVQAPEQVFGLEVFDPLIKSFIAEKLTSNSMIGFLKGIGSQLNVPLEVTEELLQFEEKFIELQFEQAAQALLRLSTLGTLGTRQEEFNTFLAQKEAALAASEKTLKAKEQVELLLKQKQQKGTSLREERPVLRDPAQDLPKTPTPPAAPQRGLTEAILYELPNNTVLGKTYGLTSNSNGFLWFAHLRTDASSPGVLSIKGEELPADQVSELTISPDGAHYAYRLMKFGRETVVLDGQPGPNYNQVGQLTFSADGSQLAYIARKEKVYHAVIAGKESQAYAAISELVFNPITGRAAYFAFQKGLWHLEMEGANEKGYALVGELRFSPDGSQHVYFAKIGQAVVAVLNGNVGPGFAGVGRFTFHPDSSDLAYIVNTQARTQSVYHKGNTGLVTDQVRKLTFAPKGSHLGYIAVKVGRERLVLNGEMQDEFNKIGGFIFSASGQEYAYDAVSAQGSFVMHNGQPSELHEQVARLSFNPRTDELAYLFHEAEGWYVALGEQRIGPYADVSDFTFDPLGLGYAYFARNKGGWSGAVRNGMEESPVSHAKHLVYSEDGQNLAYIHATKEGYYVVMNNRTLNFYAYSEILQPPRWDRVRQQFYMLAKRKATLLAVTFA